MYNTPLDSFRPSSPSVSWSPSHVQRLCLSVAIYLPFILLLYSYSGFVSERNRVVFKLASVIISRQGLKCMHFPTNDSALSFSVAQSYHVPYC